MQTVKLLFTVSGGLEDLAEDQVRRCFEAPLLVEVKWHRKPSGSQLFVTLCMPISESAHHIAQSMKQFDYIEYVFALVDSFPIVSNDGSSDDIGQISVPTILQQIENVTLQISQSSIDFCKRLCDTAREDAGFADTGLGGLPGALLPTPEISPLPPSQLPETGCEAFHVNTIYTKPIVAKAVIETISEFCEQHNHHHQRTLWVDAGSGNGALLEHMPPQNSIGIDTHPTSTRVHKMDFFEVTKSWLYQEFPDHDKRFVISNPPFSLSSRGDYAPIVKFINHSFDILEADIVGIICPGKFARERTWKSLDMTDTACLLGRFFLPKDAFYNPYNGEGVHIHSYCLIFGQKSKQIITDKPNIVSRKGVYLSAKRDKGHFPDLPTADLTKSVVSGLTKIEMEFVSERNAQYMLHAKLLESSSLELWWHINPQSPCSLMNSNSIKVSRHSLGWMSLSVTPPLALAMASMALNNNKGDDKAGKVAINLMAGEGTIELEANRAGGRSFFMISGDRNHTNALSTAKRIRTLQSNGCHCPLIDVVVWDAQNLPLRRGIADVIMADLPFQGSLKKIHQEPQVGNGPSSDANDDLPNASSLSYSKVLGETSKVLSPNGRAALLSPDYKALRHAASVYNWSQIGYGTNVNLGGLTGKLYAMQRKGACTKDLSMWVPLSTVDLSSWILSIANKVCKEQMSPVDQSFAVTNVHLHSTFFQEQKQSLSHCYRIEFDDMFRNVEAKKIEQLIRQGLEAELAEGVTLR